MAQPFRIEVAGETNVGRKRNHNEDNFAIMPDFGLFLVADGMGGHASGEVDSNLVRVLGVFAAWYLAWGVFNESIFGAVQPESVVFCSLLGLAAAPTSDPLSARYDPRGNRTWQSL